MKTCWKCGWEWPETRQPAFKETCPNCTAYLHVCKNCRLYDPKAHNNCISATTEWIPDKEDHNFCEEFMFVERRPEEVAAPCPAREQKAKEKFLKLFGEKGMSKGEGSLNDPKNKFKKIFGN